MHIRELHKGQEPFRFGVGETFFAFDPVGEGDRPARPDDTRRLGDQLFLIDDVTPCIFTPNKARAFILKTTIAHVCEREFDLVRQAFLFAPQASLLDDPAGRIDTVHPGYISKTHQEPHPGAGAATKVNALHSRADPRPFGEVHR